MYAYAHRRGGSNKGRDKHLIPLCARGPPRLLGSSPGRLDRRDPVRPLRKLLDRPSNPSSVCAPPFIAKAACRLERDGSIRGPGVTAFDPALPAKEAFAILCPAFRLCRSTSCPMNLISKGLGFPRPIAHCQTCPWLDDLAWAVSSDMGTGYGYGFNLA